MDTSFAKEFLGLKNSAKRRCFMPFLNYIFFCQDISSLGSTLKELYTQQLDTVQLDAGADVTSSVLRSNYSLI